MFLENQEVKVRTLSKSERSLENDNKVRTFFNTEEVFKRVWMLSKSQDIFRK